MTTPYRAALASIHDAGFGFVAEGAATELLARLRRAGHAGGLVVDLGCGSGVLCERMAAAGYQVLGVDLSPDLLALARRRVPSAELVRASVYDVRLPRCVAVAMVGEIGSYRFDPRATDAALERLVRRVHRALVPGGVLLLDLVHPGRVPGGHRQAHTATADWAVLVEATEAGDTVTRRITSFVREGARTARTRAGPAVEGARRERFHREEETHVLRVRSRGATLALLRGAGFSVRSLAAYGPFGFPPGWRGYACTKGGGQRRRAPRGAA